MVEYRRAVGLIFGSMEFLKLYGSLIADLLYKAN